MTCFRLTILLMSLVLPRALRADTATLDAIEAAERAESARIALIERPTPAAVAIFDENERGGGTGVIIDEHGYGLTNYHVVANMMVTRRGLGGLADGKFYRLEVLGIDPGGDVAMFRLHGKERFDHANLGDSETVHVGDSVIALGNPFMLAEDYTPTATLGIVSGVDRYQWGAGKGDTLLYSDCIQVDAAINPGNSGGPLFDMEGDVIGINGRISVSLRGRVNVGLGYAITINQIRMFMPGLRAGLLVRHGTLQAVVRDHYDDSVIFAEVMEDAPIWDAGIRPGDRLLDLDGRRVSSANTFASILGTLPANWPVTITYRKTNGDVAQTIARTEAIELPGFDEYIAPEAVQQNAIAELTQGFHKRWKDRPRSDWPWHTVIREDTSAYAGKLKVLLDALAADELSSGERLELKHLGADRIVEIVDQDVARSPVLASIEAPLDETVRARLLFANSGALYEAQIVDPISQERKRFLMPVADLSIPPSSVEHLAERVHKHPRQTSVVAKLQARTVKIMGAKVGRTVGYGSGIVISSNGLVLTVDSALLDARNLRAQLRDGKTRQLQAVKIDHDRQLALLRIVPDRPNADETFAHYDIPDSANPPRGTWVLAGGNPFKVATGAEPVSVARGVIAGRTKLDATRGTQDFSYRGDVLLLDAITSTPGFAGGALVTATGEFVGMVGRMVEARVTHTMLNYAIPADVLRDFVRSALDPDAADESQTAKDAKPVYHGIKFFELGYRSNPVYVERVRRGSPAAKAGVRKDDLIIGANGKPVAKLVALERIIEQCAPGDTLELTVMRNDEVKKLGVVLEDEK